jgi:hypothetical protein
VFKGITDEEMKKGLEAKSDIARPGYKDLFFDFLSVAPAIMGLPMSIGTPGIPKKTNKVVDFGEYLNKKKVKPVVAKPKFKPGDKVSIKPRKVLGEDMFGVNSMVADGWIEKLEPMSKSVFGRSDPISDIKIMKKVIAEQYGKESLSKFNQALNTLEPHEWPYALQYMNKKMGHKGVDSLFVEKSIERRLSPSDRQKLDMTKKWITDLSKEPLGAVRSEPWGDSWKQAFTERRNIIQKYKNRPWKNKDKLLDNVTSLPSTYQQEVKKEDK